MKNKTNSKGNTVYCERLLSVFKEIDEKNISSYEQLKEYKHIDLYTEYWLATRGFVNNVALTSKTSKNGKEPGNLYKIEGIIEAGIADEKDVQSESLARLISKFDFIINKPHEARKPYCITIVNNVVNAFGREAEKVQEAHSISLQEKAKGNKVSSEDACTYENLIGDNNTPERLYCLQEEIREGKKLLLDKLAFLSKDPTRALAHLSERINVNPRIFAMLLLKKGVEKTFEIMRQQASEVCEIPLDELEIVINTNNLKKDPFKISSNDPKLIADRISHLRNYANEVISKKF